MRSGLYAVRDTFNEELKNEGLDYSKILLKRINSSYIFKNRMMAGFLEYINDLMYVYIESVKYLRIYNNFTVNKNYKKIN